ncbi:hypothetical protein V7114_21460, partial [Neobacillus niacini]|uniref:hypothetical protein n=1 Tax=Neobacillus niacini TaxID=86668 RepID=UPI003000C5C1
MKILINYSDNNFKTSQARNTKSGLKKGGFDKVIEYGPEKLDKSFYKEHADFIENNKRGGGYWIWKPHVILKALLEEANDGDYVFYCDSGSMFINSVDHLIEALKGTKQDIFLSEIPLLEYQWTKRECFEKLGCLDERYLYSNQVQSGYILIKKSQNSVNFFKEYLTVCCDYIMVNDEKNMNINKELIDHRHDQSVLSLLSKKAGFQFFRDISQYGLRPNQYII